MFSPKRSRWPPIFFVFLAIVYHYLSSWQVLKKSVRGNFLGANVLKLYFYRKLHLLSFLLIYSLFGFYWNQRTEFFPEGHLRRWEVTLRHKKQQLKDLSATHRLKRRPPSQLPDGKIVRKVPGAVPYLIKSKDTGELLAYNRNITNRSHFVDLESVLFISCIQEKRNTECCWYDPWCVKRPGSSQFSSSFSHGNVFSPQSR